MFSALFYIDVHQKSFMFGLRAEIANTLHTESCFLKVCSPAGAAGKTKKTIQEFIQ